MFQNNSRINIHKGIAFYEQDILYDDHIYTEDMDLVIKLDYYSPGFGIALMNSEGLPLEEQKEIYLLRVGHREASITFRNGLEVKNIKSNSIIQKAPLENVTMRFVKKGKMLQLYFDDMVNPCLEYTMAQHWDRYSLGFYSNAGNTIKNVSIAASIPKYWRVNMYNTDGGYIKFIKNGFTLINCHDNAELEQEKIKLDKGIYFLKYNKSDEAGLYDINAYVYPSIDVGTRDEKKNLLKDNHFFILDEETEVTLKFKGRNGTVTNISISQKENSSYVPTTNDEDSNSLGSYIEFDTRNLKKIWWVGTVSDVPELSEAEFEDPDKTYFIAKTEQERFDWSKSGLATDIAYSYIYNADNHTLTIQIKDTESYVTSHSFKISSNILTIMKNMDSVLEKLCIMRRNSDVWEDLIIQSTSKKYVPGDITSPIVVTSKDNVPLELSSAYRYSFKEYNDLFTGEPTLKRSFVFTNWEREIFEPASSVKLEKIPSDDMGSIIVYGITRNAKYDINKIFEIDGQDMNSIFKFCPYNERVYSNKIEHVNYKTGEIYFDAEVKSKYDLLVIDYLKKDSYCINYSHEKNLYEVDISVTDKETNVLYDQPRTIEELYEISFNGSDTLQMNNVKITNHKPTDSTYLVIRKAGYYNANLSSEA